MCKTVYFQTKQPQSHTHFSVVKYDLDIKMCSTAIMKGLLWVNIDFDFGEFSTQQSRHCTLVVHSWKDTLKCPYTYMGGHTHKHRDFINS